MLAMQVDRIQTYHAHDHPNTLAPLTPGMLWVVLHNHEEVRAVGRCVTWFGKVEHIAIG